jgi:hypothetical protein
LVVHPESVATKGDFLVPPPAAVSGGEKLTVPEKEQKTELLYMGLLVLRVLAEATADDTTKTPIDTREPTTHHTIVFRICVLAPSRTCAMILTPAEMAQCAWLVKNNPRSGAVLGKSQEADLPGPTWT